MKKLILTICILLLLASTGAAKVCQSTYEITADRLILAEQGTVCGILIITNGTTDATAILYDVDAAGDIAATNKIWEGKVKAGAQFGGRNFTNAVHFKTGLYIDLDGGGASAIVEYSKSISD